MSKPRAISISRTACMKGSGPQQYTSRSRSEERRVGKECRSRCDWSSDVCSSDLEAFLVVVLHVEAESDQHIAHSLHEGLGAAAVHLALEIGRASCRERV